MNWKKAFTITTLVLIIFLINCTKTLARSYLDNVYFILSVVNKETPSGANNGSPDSEEGPGSRGDCLFKGTSLTRLVGGKKSQSTVSEHPTFWVYVPYTQQEAPSGEFSLQYGKKDVYRTAFQLPLTPGIVSISLPNTIAPLEVGKKYYWAFSVSCPTQTLTSEILSPAFVRGEVQRVSLPELQSQLNTATTPLERVTIFRKNEIWHEAITELAQLRQSQPQNPNIETAWTKLLEAVGLTKIAQAPIVGNVRANSQSKQKVPNNMDF